MSQFLLSVVLAVVIQLQPDSGESPALARDSAFAQFVGEFVEVELDTHRVVRGILDGRTDSETVWILRTSDRVTLWSGFPARRVIRCRVASADQATVLSEDNVEAVSGAAECPLDCFPDTTDWRGGDRRIASIDVRAEVANLDGDVESDGLVVWIHPLDRFGETIAVSGQVEFELLGERRDWRTGRHAPARRQFLTLERWSQRVEVADASYDGIRAVLWFRNFHPDRDLNIANNALLLARLSVPGVGLFAASDDRLFLRPWSQLRDDLQQWNGDRFFPQERSALPSRTWRW